ncbi:hypothetical protein RSOLAG22IIIB_02556 [Rhizoctonia solani]|uniref:Uncharacterized protein n=1 Tax=Rhizoctonia solani TaxID=456999 RepID=A0A0K6GGF8_9AGAM|nr:hypothetical protein RSOLAG22IIIB_02556 [Rhizoctonia solani]
MNNSRRFTPAPVRPSAPTTPRSANRALPTPPASATTTFHVPEDNPLNIRPKLPIDGFAKSKRARPGMGSHATNSPARPSRVPKQPTVDADHHSRPQRIFGQSNGLLPSLSPPPAPPSLLTRPVPQSVSARFSSPFSPPDNQDTTGNHQAEQEEDELDTPGPHISTYRPPGDPIVYERTLQMHSTTYQAGARRQNTPTSEFQGEFDNSGAESPCPSKRRATGDHGYQAPAKRKRSTPNNDQVTPALPLVRSPADILLRTWMMIGASPKNRSRL